MNVIAIKEVRLVIQDVKVQMPEPLYLRLQQAAQATKQSLNDVILRSLQVGSPPSWEEAPAEFQADLAALDRLDDSALWRIARSSQLAEDMTRYQELSRLRKAADRFLLRKAYAVDLLHWRGHAIPPAHQ